MLKKILVTGAAGFIGSKTAESLLLSGHEVLGLDNLNDYYDVRLKQYRLELLSSYKNFKFKKLDIEHFDPLKKEIRQFKPSAVINLAARVGVRYSLQTPFVYLKTNTLGTLNLLELCKDLKIFKFVLASTSSLYADERMPFKESLPVNQPISPYAATKKGAEALCYTYHFLYGIDVSILRYFTVYGPAGRPDMSYFKFIKQILEGKEILIYGDCSQSRDFTYIDDIVSGTVKGLRKVEFQIVNLGGNKPHRLECMIQYIEEDLGKKARRRYRPFHKADLMTTCADISNAKNVLGWKPTIGLREGIRRTVRWFKDNDVLVRKIKLLD